MEIRTDAYTDRDKKIWFVSPTIVKYKLEVDGQTKIIQIDISNAIDGINYKPNRDNDLYLYAVAKSPPPLEIARLDLSVDYQLRRTIDTTIPDDPADPAYPVFVYGSGTDEPATDTWIFPPPETHEKFMERVWARLLNLTRRIKILRHEEPHQNALSTNICP